MNMRHAEQTQSAGQKGAGGTPNGRIKVDAWRNIDGLAAYTIAADGTPRKWGRPMTIDKNAGGVPVIDINGVERPLDEVVAAAFLGPAPCPLKFATVIHFDGDSLNCRVDNIKWQTCPEWAETSWESQTRTLMAPAYMRPTKQRIHFFT
jgi:hypothetical protein